MKYNILFDFSSIVSGGGAQLAINFMDMLALHLNEIDMNPVVLCPAVGPIRDNWNNHLNIPAYHNPSQYAPRIRFERNQLPKIYSSHQIERIYTFFGPGLPHPKEIISYVGVAYPIICNPDSQYWKYLATRSCVRQKVINKFRVNRLKKYANHIIAETPIMAERLKKYCGLKNVHIVSPAPSEYLKYSERSTDSPPHDVNRIGLLSGIDQHKNLWRLPAIAYEMLRDGTTDFEFVISISEKVGEKLLEGYPQVRDYFNFVGNISPKKIESFYTNIDTMMNISDLESYSNNYMEAWTMKKPIIASDRDFSHGILSGSGYYVDPHAIGDTAKKIIHFISEKSIHAEMIQAGAEKLAQLPTQEERFKQVLGKICD